MKNMKIRLKILISFGIATVLTLGLSGFVILSNLTTNQNAENIRAEVQLQALSASLMNSFLEAQEHSAVISNTFNDAEYDNIVARLEECRGYITQMQSLIAQNPVLTSFTQQVDSVAGEVEAWGASIDILQADNKKLEEIIAAATANQESLTNLSMGIFSYQMELSIDEAQQPELTPADRIDRVGRVEQGMDIATRLNYIGGAFDAMFRALDTSRIEEDLAYFDSTVTVLEDFRANSQLQYNLLTTASMLGALEVYRNNIDEFLLTMEDRATARQNAGVSSEIALAGVSELVEGSEQSSLSIIDVTISANMRAFYIVIAIAAVVTAVSIILALYISGLISRPINILTSFLKKAGATGDIEMTQADTDSIRQYGHLKDEIGQCISGAASFVGHVTQIAQNLETIAAGNLTADVKLLSDRDTMGNSLKNTLESLNEMFSDIKAAAVQVASGSRQIADGAQALAQGSTEQAATVQQLSASTTDIAEKTKANAGMASEAAELAGDIMHVAGQGNRQMDAMLSAVNDINQASQDIGKVIKAIDDIAFQTNILALNAAVEAARAGAHGKGFAVVADEVRNLAAKSAEAAKDTGGLIANSIEKAQLGARIAAETAESLAKIVTGIGKSDKLVNDISNSSELQSGAISQINAAIDQVAQVVQQNSATAEQSAASSQQLNSQAAILEQLLSHFRLKDAAFSPQPPVAAKAQSKPEGAGFALNAN